MTDASDADRQLEELLAEHREDDTELEGDSADSGPDPLDPLAAIPGLEDTVRNAGEPADKPSDTTPGSDDPHADPLPDAPLFALLRRVHDDVGSDRIDRMWVFPPRRLEAAETAVVVVAAFPDDDHDRRRVYAAHYTALEDADEPRLVLREFGTAPTDRVGRLVEEVVERLNDDSAGAPRSHRIEGDAHRWNEVLHGLAEDWLAEAQRDRRLRR